jgi:hypothetical protein
MIKLNNDNKTMLIGLLTILIILWVVLYMIPILFVYIFDTLLGNLILIIIVILIGVNNPKYGILLATIFVILYRSYHLSQLKKEGFEWTDNSRANFLLVQKTINPNNIFDTEITQQQASQEEVDYFLKNGYWPWSKKVEELYKEMLEKNSYIRTYSKNEIERVKTIYNQNAILNAIALQTKEGQFLLNGVSIKSNSINPLENLPSGWGDFGYTSGLIEPMDDVIKCHIDDNDKASLQKIVYTGKGGIFEQQTKNITPVLMKPVDHNDLEKLIPGFSFVKGRCDPCQALKSPPNYSCPFNLDISGNETDGISPIWKYLWGL